jgi:hypothetical protein
MRRCVKCGEIKDLAEFQRHPTAEQVDNYGWLRNDVDSPMSVVDMPDGTRGYTRTVQGVQRRRLVINPKCNDCHKWPPRKPVVYSATYKALRKVLTREQSRVCSMLSFLKANPEPTKHHYYELRRKVLIEAALEARNRARRGLGCPSKWWTLIPQERRDELEHAHFGVSWRRRVPVLFERDGANYPVEDSKTAALD